MGCFEEPDVRRYAYTPALHVETGGSALRSLRVGGCNVPSIFLASSGTAGAIMFARSSGGRLESSFRHVGVIFALIRPFKIEESLVLENLFLW